MNEDWHPAVAGFGPPVGFSSLNPGRAADLAVLLEGQLHPDATLLRCWKDVGAFEAVLLVEVRPERSQVRAADVRRCEPVLVCFPPGGGKPLVLCARADFPFTPHQYAVPSGEMRAPCVDDRPWDDASATWTSYAFIEMILRWMSAAAAGELTGDGQAVEPRFMGSLIGLVLPRATYRGNAYVRARLPDTGEPRLVLCDLASTPSVSDAQFRVLAVPVPPQTSGAVRDLPRNLADLDAELRECGVDVLKAVGDEAISNVPTKGALNARLIVVIAIPIRRRALAEPEKVDLRAFVSHMTMGQIGQKLGRLDHADEQGGGFVRAIGTPRAIAPQDVRLDTLQVHTAFDGILAAICSGLPGPDTRKTVLVGAGAVGSHLAACLVRGGQFSWTVIDPDILLPHNLARHALLSEDLGRPKATGVATMLNRIGGTGTAVALPEDILHPSDKAAAEAIASALSDADVVVDASASVAVARSLSDEASSARKCSVFLNPHGDAAVLLVEDDARRSRLDALEGVYYRLVLEDASLERHLAPPAEGFRYAGACRAVTNRIPEANVAALTAIAARSVTASLMSACASVKVWVLEPSGSVVFRSVPLSAGRRVPLGSWQIVVDDDLVRKATAERAARLPAETGGVLVGTVDTARKVIVLVDVLPAPEDSVGTREGFERGTDRLGAALAAIAERSGGQVRYVGEWHSHPEGSGTSPSRVDVDQLAFLRDEMAREGLPAVMMIVGGDGAAFASMAEEAAGSGVSDP